MGFPSPAADYAEPRLTINSLCGIDANCSAVETAEGYAVINRTLTPSKGQSVLIEYQGQMAFASVDRGRLVTNDGVIKGDSLDDTNVLGVVTFFIKKVHEIEDSTPF